MKVNKIDLLRISGMRGISNALYCRVYTDTGIYGDGEVSLGFGNATNAAFGILKDMARHLIGADPLENEVIWRNLYHRCFWGRTCGPIIMGGISAFDIALWDIKGKAYGAPVHQLLGGKHRDRLRAYASQLQDGWGTERKPCGTLKDYANTCRIAAEQGFDAVKLNYFMFREDGMRWKDVEHTGLLQPDLLHLIESCIAITRETLGENADIILENHAYTDVLSAIQFGKMAEKYNIYYFEEPVAPDPDLLKKVRAGLQIPIADGERLYGRWQFHKILENGSVQIILQFEAALPNFVIHEYNVNCIMPEMLELTVNNPQPVDGYFLVSDKPGIGNEISPIAYQRASEIVTVE